MPQSRKPPASRSRPCFTAKANLACGASGGKKSPTIFALAKSSSMCKIKPVTRNERATGQGRSLVAFASIRKGQAFQSPLIPNSETGTVTGRSASCGRLTAAHRARGNRGIAAWPTVERKLDAGRNRERPIKNQRPIRLVRHGRVYKRRIGSEVYGQALQLSNRWGVFLPFADRKESYVYRSGFSPRFMKG